jgi:hypothetical protein
MGEVSIIGIGIVMFALTYWIMAAKAQQLIERHENKP